MAAKIPKIGSPVTRSMRVNPLWLVALICKEKYCNVSIRLKKMLYVENA